MAEEETQEATANPEAEKDVTTEIRKRKAAAAVKRNLKRVARTSLRRRRLY